MAVASNYQQHRARTPSRDQGVALQAISFMAQLQFVYGDLLPIHRPTELSGRPGNYEFRLPQEKAGGGRKAAFKAAEPVAEDLAAGCCRAMSFKKLRRKTWLQTFLVELRGNETIMPTLMACGPLLLSRHALVPQTTDELFQMPDLELLHSLNTCIFNNWIVLSPIVPDVMLPAGVTCWAPHIQHNLTLQTIEHSVEAGETLPPRTSFFRSAESLLHLFDYEEECWQRYMAEDRRQWTGELRGKRAASLVFHQVTGIGPAGFLEVTDEELVCDTLALWASSTGKPQSDCPAKSMLLVAVQSQKRELLKRR